MNIGKPRSETATRKRQGSHRMKGWKDSSAWWSGGKSERTHCGEQCSYIFERQWQVTLVHLYRILILSMSNSGHHTWTMLSFLPKAGVSLRLRKCFFSEGSIYYLGYTIQHTAWILGDLDERNRGYPRISELHQLHSVKVLPRPI